MNDSLNKSQRYLFNFIYFIFVFSLVHIIGIAIKLDINIIYQMLIVILLIALVKFLIYHPIIFPVVLIFTSIILALVNKYMVEFIGLFLDRIIHLFVNIFNNIQGTQRILEENIIWFWIIITLLISAFTCFFIFKRKRPWILFSIYIPIFIYYWYSFFDRSFLFMSLFLIFFMVLIGLNSYLREKQRVSSSYDYDLRHIYSNWQRTLIVYSFTIVFLALIIPKNTDYIAWPWLNRKVTSVFPGIEEFRSSQKYSRRNGETNLFDFSTTGFMGKDKKLGGPVELSDKIVMTVSTSKSIYLRGNTKEKYTGFSWISNGKSYKNYNLKDDFSGLSDEEKVLYYEEEDITITNNLFASTTIFSPYKASKVFSNYKYHILVDSNDNIKTPDGIYKDESYLVRVQRPLPYGIAKSNGSNNKKSDLLDLEDYIQIPDTISDRTVELTKKIVLDKQIDFEKAVAIENYLRKNFKYNLQVEDIPPNYEFLDYFLFEAKEGYCTYYATAMAIMLRIENIPSRYIEGYLLKDKLEDGQYQVSQKNAHAWVEAFIEPVGWITFEATPAFSVSPRYENYDTIAQITDESALKKQNILLEDFKNLSGDRDDTNNSIQDDGNINIYNQPSNNKGFNSKYTLLTLISLVFLFFILNIIKNIINTMKKKKQFKTLSNGDKIILLYKDICNLIELLGYPQKPGETHFEYADRINYKFYDLDNISIKEVTEIFVKAKYSQIPNVSNQVNILLDFKLILEKRLRKYLGKTKYYYKKYIKANF